MRARKTGLPTGRRRRPAETPTLRSASGVGVRVKGSRTLGLAVPMFGVGVSTGRRGRGLLLIRRCSLTMLVFHLACTFLRGIPIGGFSGVGCDGGCRCPV